MNMCNTKDKYWRFAGKLFFKAFHITKRLPNTDKNFKLKDGETVNGEFRLALKRSSAHGITIDKKGLL